ncbi:MAG: YfcE family phosphodiesterase [bacterium]
MKIGIIADTHDNLAAINFLVNYYNHREADFLLHAGDYIAPFTIGPLADFDGRVVGVFGNNDGDKEMLKEKAAENNVELYQSPHRLKLDNKNILLAHRPEDLPEEISDEIDVVINGHTHCRRAVENSYQHFNPGEAGGWLTDTTSGIIYETETEDHEWIVVPAP